MSEPARLRTVAETLAAEAAAFVRRRRAEVFGAAAAGAKFRQRRGAVEEHARPIR